MLRGALEHVGSMLTTAKDDGEIIRGKLVAVLRSGLARFSAGAGRPTRRDGDEITQPPTRRCSPSSTTTCDHSR